MKKRSLPKFRSQFYGMRTNQALMNEIAFEIIF